MGYDYRFDPSKYITIKPSIDYNQLALLKEGGFVNDRNNVYIRYETQNTVENGAQVSRIVRSIIVGTDGNGRNPLNSLREIVNLLPQHTFAGQLRAVGMLGDHLRWWVTDDRLIAEEEAKLVWPDGTTEPIQV